MASSDIPESSKAGAVNHILVFDSTEIETLSFLNSTQKFTTESAEDETLTLSADDGGSFQTLTAPFGESFSSSLKDVVLVEPEGDSVDINQLYLFITPEEKSSSVFEINSSSIDKELTSPPNRDLSLKNDSVISVPVTDMNFENAQPCDTKSFIKKQNVTNKKSDAKRKLIDKNLNSLTIEDSLSQDNSSLLTQPVSKTSKKTIICDKCKAVFKSPSQYYLHRNTHLPNKDGKSLWSCAQCGKEFESHNELVNHEFLEHGEVRLFPCPYCVHSFDKQLLLNYHIRSAHHGEKQFRCKVCRREFFRMYDLKVHLNIHFNIKCHLCQFCGQQFNNQSNLYRHQRSHTHVKPYMCSVCGRRFAQMSSLVSHKVSHTSGGSCLECRAKFRSTVGLAKHMNMAHGKKITHQELNKIFNKYPEEKTFRFYHCIICAERFRFKKALTMHEKVTHSNQCFPCRSCFKVFSTINDFRLHPCIRKKSLPSDHSTLNPDSFECFNCLKVFECYRDAENHICIQASPNLVTQEENRNYKIEITKDDFNEETITLCITTNEDGAPLLNNDVNLTLNLPPDLADRCTLPPQVQVDLNDVYKSSSSYINSLSKVASDNLLKHTCTKELTPSIPKEATKKQKNSLSKVASNNLLKHRPPTHTKKLTPSVPKEATKKQKIWTMSNGHIKCSHCSKIFTKKWNWQQHVATHDASLRKYICEECGKSFSYRSTYTYHLKTHNNIELISHYKCSECPKVYNLKGSLVQHKKRVHDQQLNYKCSLCPRRFFGKSEYLYHMRVHLNDFIYLCHVCGNEFTHVSHLYRHQKIHTGERPHKCPYCPKSFIQAVTLRIHMKKHNDVTGFALQEGEEEEMSKDDIMDTLQEQDEMAVITLDGMSIMTSDSNDQMNALQHPMEEMS